MSPPPPETSTLIGLAQMSVLLASASDLTISVVYARGHVLRKEEHYVGRRSMEMKVQGRRKRGRPKRIRLDRIKNDIKEECWLVKCTTELTEAYVIVHRPHINLE